ncbi:hypothetical protein JCM33374_g5860 [Metschnikowia sp. JCM 33374]|nr:hypothetical protein JCM33374_g5860 [Metschnikowia sp. JCM 33374]
MYHRQNSNPHRHPSLDLQSRSYGSDSLVSGMSGRSTQFLTNSPTHYAQPLGVPHAHSNAVTGSNSPINPNSDVPSRTSQLADYISSRAQMRGDLSGPRITNVANVANTAAEQSSRTRTSHLPPGASSGSRYSRTAFDSAVDQSSYSAGKVKGILGIELSKEAFQASRENTPVPQSATVDTSDNVDESEENANTTFSPLNNLIQDMAIQTPSNKKRTMSGDNVSGRNWNKRLSRQGSVKAKFDPREINKSEIIELDD